MDNDKMCGGRDSQSHPEIDPSPKDTSASGGDENRRDHHTNRRLLPIGGQMKAAGKCKIREGDHGHRRKCPENVKPRHLVFEGAEWLPAVLPCFALLLPLDESLMFNSVEFGEIASGKFCI